MSLLFIYFIIINVLGFGMIWYDKNLAKNNQYRISEKILLSIVVFGGMIGSGLSMLLFRHKTSKNSYLLKFFGIIIVEILVFYIHLL